MSDVFESPESEAPSYCRGWNIVFERASGGFLSSVGGRRYLDFFSGAGASKRRLGS